MNVRFKLAESQSMAVPELPPLIASRILQQLRSIIAASVMMNDTVKRFIVQHFYFVELTFEPPQKCIYTTVL